MKNERGARILRAILSRVSVGGLFFGLALAGLGQSDLPGPGDPQPAQELELNQLNFPREDDPPVRENTVVDVIKEHPHLSTFSRMIEAAGMRDRLIGYGAVPAHWTVLAPSDSAFADLDPDVIERMTNPDYRVETARIIERHLLGRALDAEGMENATQLTNNNFDPVEVERVGPGPLVVRTMGYEARIIERNLEADRAYVHVIDRLLTRVDPESFARGRGAPDS